VYEIACFLSLHPLESLQVLPTKLPFVFFSGLMGYYLVSTTLLLAEMHTEIPYIHALVLTVFAVPLHIAQRSWAREKTAVHDRLSNFSVQHCLCSCEDDRPLVYANIAALTKALMGIRQDVADEVALHAFDSLVRNNLPQALLPSLGHFGFHYKFLCILSSSLTLPVVVDELAGFAHGMPVRYFLVHVLRNVALAFAVIPLSIALAESVATRCLRLWGWHELIFWSVAFLAVAPVCGCGTISTVYVLSWASRSNIGLAVLVAGTVFLCLLTWRVFFGCACCRPSLHLPKLFQKCVKSACVETFSRRRSMSA